MNSRSMPDRDSSHIQPEYVDYHSLPNNQGRLVARPLGSELANHDFETHHKVSRDKRNDYKPTTLRLPFLVTLLTSLLVMMGLLAYSLDALPHKDFVDSLLDQGDGTAARRGLYLDADRRVTARMPSTTTVPGTIPNWTTSTTSDDNSMTVSDAFGVIDTTVSMSSTSYTPEVSTMTSDAFGVIDTTISKSSTSYIPEVSTTASDAFGHIDTTITPTRVSSPPSEAFGVISTTVTGSGSSLSLPTTTNREDSVDVGESTSSAASTMHGKAGQSVTLPIVTYVTYVTEPVTTLTNSEGLPTYTTTRVPSAISIPTTTTLTNLAGKPTTTITSDILATPVTSVMTNSRGITTATVVLYPSLTASTESTQVFYISPSEYFVGFCLPTLLSIIVAIPIRALNMNAKLFQPWHALTHPFGALGFESLNLPTCGVTSYANGIRSL